MPTINIYDAIHVSFSKRWGYPFNLKFKSTIKDDRANGPGVYLISFKDSPVYFGKYQPFRRNNIFDDRWLRHIETITLRGERVGFGPNSTLNKVLPTVCDDLKTILNKLSEDELCYRMRDTGVCSSDYRRAFASQNWIQLSTATPNNILDDFDFRYYKIDSIQNGEQAKKVTTYIENAIIKEFCLSINNTKGRIKPQSIDCIESRVFELTQNHDLEMELELHLNGRKWNV
ncbi:hypothetical protein [Desulfitobacterium sp.]|uniref:Uncharacterized protein n=1 Tax=bioreactor metagenome TaxID=1076179 RepID=A0A644V8Z2_9ZZZZ|nr:hypothetical protein [Desulfitobacterium sp.]MEA4901970.1 hypothetical protein [Desulfitobacterium sp.]